MPQSVIPMLAVAWLFSVSRAVMDGDAVPKLLPFPEPEAVAPQQQLHGHRRRDAECDPMWTKLSAAHTMCLEDVGVAVELSQATKDSLVQQHNTYRAQVDPPAKHMPVMTWDEDLAMVAGKWARQCIVGHEANFKDRQVPSLSNVYNGQNVAAGYGSFYWAVKGWHREVDDYQYGVGSSNGGVVGHYTQIVTQVSLRIGCGQADCGGTPFYACNYAEGQHDSTWPYGNGTGCSGCPDKCDSEFGTLCDCQDKFCHNGGDMTFEDCSCTCPEFFSGDSCEILTCPGADPWYCADWPESNCRAFTNAFELCPYLCGICPADVTSPPTDAPTEAPTDAPTDAQTDAATDVPTDSPTPAPTNAPTDAATDAEPACSESGAPSIANGAVTSWSEDTTSLEGYVSCDDDFVYDGDDTPVVTCVGQDQWQVSMDGTCRQRIWRANTVSVDVTYPLPTPIYVGWSVCITAQSTGNRFSANLVDDANNIPLHTDFRLNVPGYEPSVIQDVFWNNYWRDYKATAVPFTVGQQFTIKITATGRRRFDIDANGVYQSHVYLPYPVKIDMVTGIVFQGDVSVSYLDMMCE